MKRTKKSNALESAFSGKCPAQLGPSAAMLWDQIVPYLEEEDLLKAQYLPILGMFCHYYTQWINAAQAVQREGSVVETKNGNLVQNPWVSVCNQAATMSVNLARQLGLSPAARGKLPFRIDDPLLIEN